MSTSVRTYSLDHDGHALTVELGVDGSVNTARLLVDGRAVDEQRKDRVDSTKLTADGIEVAVSWWWTGRVLRCELVEPAHGGRPHKTPFEPPEGTRAHRLWQLQQDRPGLYAARHVALAAGQVLATVLGLGVLLGALLPRIDWSWLPDIPTGWVPDADIPDPLGWLWDRLPDVEVPGWVSAVAESWKWWGPILIAILVAQREYERRKQRLGSRRSEEEGEPG
jgi:hypothetical protein